MKEIKYKGQDCLIVYHIPMWTEKKGKKVKQKEFDGSDQLTDRVYLSHPFNFTVSVDELR